MKTTTTTILTLLMAMIMSQAAFAQFEKLTGVSVSAPAQTGTVTLTRADLVRTAAILRAEGAVEAPDADYSDPSGRKPVNLAELKVMDVKTLTSFLAVMAEACDRLATGVAVTYPSQEKVDELVRAFRKIKVLGPTGATTVPEIQNAYNIAIAILQKRVVCVDPAPPPTSAQPAPAQSPTPAPKALPAQSPATPAPTSASPASAPAQSASASAQPPAPSQAEKAKDALARLQATRPAPPRPANATP